MFNPFDPDYDPKPQTTIVVAWPWILFVGVLVGTILAISATCGGC